MINELRIKKIKKLLRDKRRLKRKARALEIILKTGLDSMEIEVMKSSGVLKAKLKAKYNTAGFHYSQHLGLMTRLETQTAELEEEIEVLKNQQQNN